VDEASFRTTQSGLFHQLEDRIWDELDINWSKVQYDDLSKPLYSGIAARLKIAAYYRNRLRGIPQSVADQASYWASSYTVNTWTNAIIVYVKANADVATGKYFSFISRISHV